MPAAPVSRDRHRIGNSASAGTRAGDQTANFTVDNSYVAVRPGTWDYPINGGVWTSAPSYNAGVTTFTAAGVEDYMTGWTLIPDVTKPCALTVQVADGLAAGGILIVAGDATGLCASGDVFRIVPPAGVSVSSGALAAAQSAGLNTFDDPGCMWLWSGYRYIPPQVGHDIGGTTYGAQPGGNKLGQYSCWNRTYDVLTARWTTPTQPDLLTLDSPWLTDAKAKFRVGVRTQYKTLQDLDRHLADLRLAGRGPCGWDVIVAEDGTATTTLAIDYRTFDVEEDEVQERLGKGESHEAIATEKTEKYLLQLASNLSALPAGYTASQVGDLRSHHTATKAKVAAKCPSPCRLTFYLADLEIRSAEVRGVTIAAILHGRQIDEREPLRPKHKVANSELYRVIGVRAELSFKFTAYYRAVCKENTEQEERF